MAGGKKTNNIVVPLKSRFKSGAVQLDTEETIDDIISYIIKGEVFDRAVIIEPAIVGEKSEKGLDYARVKMVELLSKLGDSRNDVQFIFVVTTQELADVIKEEMFGLGEYRVKVILAKAKYKLKFFIQLCTLELSEIPNTYESISATKITEDMVRVDTVEGEKIEAVVPERKFEDFDTEEKTDSDAGLNDTGEEFNSNEEEPNNIDEFSSFDESVLNDPEKSEDEEIIEPFDGDDVEHIEEGTDEKDEESWGFDNVGTAGTDEYSDPENGSYIGDEFNTAENLGIFHDRDTEIEQKFDDIDGAGTGEFADPEKDKDADNGLGEKPIARDGFTWDNDDENSDTEQTTEEVINEDTQEPVVEEPVDEPLTAELTEEPVEIQPFESEPNVTGEDAFGVPNETSDIDESQYFGETVYNEGENKQEDIEQALDNDDIRALKVLLANVANRKMSFVVTGSQGSGKTTVAYNLATLLANMGYPTLYVDCDTETRGVSYIDSKVYKWVHTDDLTVGALPAAIGNVSNLIKYVGVIKPSLHVLTLGLDQDLKPLDKIGAIDRDKIHKFSSVVRTNYSYVIYDIPFDTLKNCAVDLVYSCEKLLYMTDSTTRGMVNLMLDVADIEDDDLRQLVMRKTDIVLNKVIKGCKLFGRNITKSSKLLEQLDNIIYEVVGDNVTDRFGSMNVTKTLPFVPEIENFWFTKKAFVDTRNGVKFMGGLLGSILEA